MCTLNSVVICLDPGGLLRPPLVLLGFAVHTRRIGFPYRDRQHLIFGQMIMIIEVFVSQGKTDYSLGLEHTLQEFELKVFTPFSLGYSEGPEPFDIEALFSALFSQLPGDIIPHGNV